MSVITVKEELRSVIVLPEISFNAGWTDLSKKIEVFINKDKILKKETTNPEKEIISGTTNP